MQTKIHEEQRTRILIGSLPEITGSFWGIWVRPDGSHTIDEHLETRGDYFLFYTTDRFAVPSIERYLRLMHCNLSHIHQEIDADVLAKPGCVYEFGDYTLVVPVLQESYL